MKKVLITGGNKGIGLAAVKMFLEKDYEVIALGRDFSKYPYKNETKMIEFDCFNVDDIKALADEIGFVDVLVNNAGVMNSLPHDSYPCDKKERLMNVNLYAPIEFITQFSKFMVEKGTGRIVNVASVAGQIGHPDIWYGVSKAGLINATKSFAKILAPKGIVVNAVAPGPTFTDMMAVIPEDRKDAMKANTYTKQFAEAEDVAKAILWLSTDSPEYINGICVDVNNGAYPR